MDIGSVIRKKRKDKGLSVDTLSQKAKVSYNSVVNVECGKMVTVTVLTKLCDVLGLELTLTEKNTRKLTISELQSIAESIARDVRDGLDRTFCQVDDTIDVEVYYDAAVAQHREDDHENGTGAWVVDDCRVSITKFEILTDDNTFVDALSASDLRMLELAIEKLISV